MDNTVSRSPRIDIHIRTSNFQPSPPAYPHNFPYNHFAYHYGPYHHSPSQHHHHRHHRTTNNHNKHPEVISNEDSSSLERTASM